MIRGFVVKAKRVETFDIARLFMRHEEGARMWGASAASFPKSFNRLALRAGFTFFASWVCRLLSPRGVIRARCRLMTDDKAQTRLGSLVH